MARLERTRLQWTKKDGWHVSESVLAGKVVVVARIDPVNLVLEVRDLNGKNIYHADKADSIQKAKAKAKAALKDMSARFYSEVRPRKQ